MNNAIRQCLAIGFAVASFTFIQAQDSTIVTAMPADTGSQGTPNRLDYFNSFYMHPLSSHYEGRMLMGDAGVTFSSNAMVNNLAFDFYFKKSLNGADIQTSLDKVSAINIAGRETTGSLQYLFPHKKYNNFFFVKYAYMSHQSGKFTNDFANLVFKGNKHFAGRELIADDFRFLSTRYDGLQFGWLRYFTIKGRRANIAVSAGPARGYSYRSFFVKKARIFTEENGEFIEASLDLDLERTYYSPLNPWRFTDEMGYGAIADVQFNMALTEKTGIGASITDIGFLSWNTLGMYNRTDTNIRFEGVFIVSPDSLGDENYSNRVGDSIVNRFKIPYSRGGFTNMLPMHLSLTYYMKFTEKNFLNIRFNTMAFASFRTQLNIESVNMIADNFYSVTGVSIGGWGPFDIYQNIGWRINKRHFASLNLFGIEGMLMPARTAGFGFRVGYAVKL